MWQSHAILFNFATLIAELNESIAIKCRFHIIKVIYFNKKQFLTLDPMVISNVLTLFLFFSMQLYLMIENFLYEQAQVWKKYSRTFKFSLFTVLFKKIK